MKIFLDMDGTIARFNVKNAVQNFKTKEHFFLNLLPYKNIGYINDLAEVVDIYIISASPHKKADEDKRQWLSKYLPNIPTSRVVFSRPGENKAEVIRNKLSIDIDNSCYLLDDYTKNLEEWELLGGIGIKRLTTASDNSRGIWKGLTLKDLKDLLEVLSC